MYIIKKKIRSNDLPKKNSSIDSHEVATTAAIASLSHETVRRRDNATAAHNFRQISTNSTFNGD